jgi:large subunit ribosomal protein L31
VLQNLGSQNSFASKSRLKLTVQAITLKTTGEGLHPRAGSAIYPRLNFRSREMKAETHPDYHEITVQMTDGTSYKTYSTYGKEGDTLKLDIDPSSHPAWTGVHRLIDTGGQLAKFNKRFESFGLKG